MGQLAQGLGGIFFKRTKLFERIRVGARFRRELPAQRVETAEVIDVFNDVYSVPHVRFEFTIRRPGREPYGSGPRVMALKRFCREFVELPSR